jgi:hypothetical protein
MFCRILALALAVAATAASAQSRLYEDPDWKEAEAPPPPAVSTRGLIALDIPGATLHFAVDPRSVSVGADRVVRYVVVATSNSGTVNAIYEGIRCDGGEVKVYARHNPDSGWVPARNSEWQPLQSTANSRHSLFIARNGACLGRGANGNAAQVVSDLRAPVDTRFERGGVNR